MSLWDQVRGNMSDWYAIAADKTEEMARIGVRKYDKFTISRDIERAFTDLGGHVFAAASEGRTDFTGDPIVQSAVDRIRVLEQQLEQKEREILAIRSAAKPWPVAPGQPPAAAAAGAAITAQRSAEPGEGRAADARTSASRSPNEPGPPDEADIEASLDPTAVASPVPGSEAWDDEIALWNEPIELDEEPGDDEGRPRDHHLSPD